MGSIIPLLTDFEKKSIDERQALPEKYLGLRQHWAEQHPDVDVVYSHRCTCDSKNRVMWYWILPEHSNYRMMRWDLIPQVDKMIEKYQTCGDGPHRG